MDVSINIVDIAILQDVRNVIQTMFLSMDFAAAILHVINVMDLISTTVLSAPVYYLRNRINA